jgi:hypothetical protein
MEETKITIQSNEISTEPKAWSAETLMLSKYQPPEAVEKENRSGWVDYGSQNNYPQYLIELYKSSPIHNALVTTIAFMIKGKGTDTILDNALEGICLDLKMQGSFVAEVIWNIDYTEIVRINHLPFENCRLAYDRETDEVNGIWYSRDWQNSRSKKGKPEFIPMYNPECAQTEPRQVIYGHGIDAGSVYYPKPDYYGALNYIELSHQMGLYHVNNILNGLFPSFIINFVNGIPDKEMREQLRREWEDKLSGASNSGKFIMTFNQSKEQAPEITPFPLTDADKQYQFLSEETAKQIMVAHRITSPLLFGIRDNTGFGSNKEEMQIALDIFNHQVIQPYQRIICNAFEEILGEINIQLNSPFESAIMPAVETPTAIDGPVAPDAPVAAPATDSKVSDVTYNGAQIASALEIVAAVGLGTLTQEQAIVFLVQFLGLDVEVAKSMFNVTGAGDAVSKLELARSEKKKIERRNITQEESISWIEHLKNSAEYLDEEEWECISEEDVIDTDHEAKLHLEKFSADPFLFMNPDEKSKWGDKGLYKLRYQYSQNGGGKDSRDFCQEMVAMSKGGALFRYEDITNMSKAGVNEKFAPSGQNSYDIFTWKGGVYCHHFWKRKVFFRKKEKGKFLPNEGMKNEQPTTSVPSTLPSRGEEAIKPNNTESRGSLKYQNI